MKLIVGLGNVGLKYAFTRHNTGFLVIDFLLKHLGDLKLTETKFKGVFTKTKINDEQIIIAKPLTFMNLSGEFIKPISDFYKIESKDIIVVYDEISFNVGRIKITKTGSSAGHNGIKSIITNLSTENFIKVRVGIGPKPTYIELMDYVLMKYNSEEFELQKTNMLKAKDAIIDIVTNGVEYAMNKYNVQE